VYLFPEIICIILNLLIQEPKIWVRQTQNVNVRVLQLASMVKKELCMETILVLTADLIGIIWTVPELIAPEIAFNAPA
jgi:hypothetical protein